eukprot:36446-Amphidinium_carterae.1
MVRALCVRGWQMASSLRERLWQFPLFCKGAEIPHKITGRPSYKTLSEPYSANNNYYILH